MLPVEAVIGIGVGAAILVIVGVVVAIVFLCCCRSYIIKNERLCFTFLIFFFCRKSDDGGAFIRVDGSGNAATSHV